MPSPPPAPTSEQLTARFCLNTTALRDFLRLSRAAVDDSISAHLNSLVQPGAAGFSASSTAARPTASTLSRGRQNVPAPVCDTFKQRILFPSWRSRDDILEYCGTVAAAPDPSAVPAAADLPPSDDRTTARMNRNVWGKELAVDERLDPYSARDYSYARASEAQMLKDILANEQGVERIVRARTWSVLAERCLGSTPQDYTEDFGAWKSSQKEES